LHGTHLRIDPTLLPFGGLSAGMCSGFLLL
jgi:hypothetical protein